MDKALRNILIIAAITLLVYSNTFRNEFAYDDHTHIIENPQIRYAKNIPKFFTSTFNGGLYRPLRSILYMSLYALSDENPFGYHLMAIILHTLNVALVYLIVKSLLKNNTVAFISSLLFALHPIHAGRVTNITASFDQLGIFFIFLTFMLYLLNAEKENRLFMSLSIASFVLALLSSEEAIVIPLLLVLYDVCFRRGKLRHNYGIYLLFGIIGLIYLFLRFSIIKTSNFGTYISGSFYLTMLTMTKVFAKYILLLILPTNLTLYHNIITPSSIADVKVILSLILLVSIAILAVQQYKKNPLITFIAGWFFITLIPFSNLLPFRNLMAERYLYIPSFAFCLLVALFIVKLYNTKAIMKPFAISLFIIIVLAYSALTIQRNAVWKDDLTLWQSTVKVSPQSSEAHDNLGFAYEQRGLIDQAISEFEKAVMLDHSNFKAYTNLGTSYGQKGNLTASEAHLKTAIRINPNYYKAHNYLGLIYAKQGMFNNSIQEFKKALELNPDFDEPYFNMGVVYEYLGEYTLAKQWFQKAFMLNPKDPTYIQKLKTIDY